MSIMRCLEGKNVSIFLLRNEFNCKVTSDIGAYMLVVKKDHLHL